MAKKKTYILILIVLMIIILCIGLYLVNQNNSNQTEHNQKPVESKLEIIDYSIEFN